MLRLARPGHAGGRRRSIEVIERCAADGRAAARRLPRAPGHRRGVRRRRRARARAAARQDLERAPRRRRGAGRPARRRSPPPATTRWPCDRTRCPTSSRSPAGPRPACVMALRHRDAADRGRAVPPGVGAHRGRAPDARHVDGPAVTRWRRRSSRTWCATSAPWPWRQRPRRRRRALGCRTPQPVVRKIVHLRWKQRLGPVRDRRPRSAWRPRRCTRCWSAAGSTGSPTSTGRTGEPIRRYEHDLPRLAVHVDVKKLGNIPDGGGWRYVGRAQGRSNRAAHRPASARNAHHHPSLGTAYVHTVLDDHSRVAYAEIHDDETAATAIACCATRWPGSPPAASPSSGSCPTTARPTAPTPGATPAPSSASRPSAPGPTGRSTRNSPPLPPPPPKTPVVAARRRRRRSRPRPRRRCSGRRSP